MVKLDDNDVKLLEVDGKPVITVEIDKIVQFVVEIAESWPDLLKKEWNSEFAANFIKTDVIWYYRDWFEENLVDAMEMYEGPDES